MGFISSAFPCRGLTLGYRSGPAARTQSAAVLPLLDTHVEKFGDVEAGMHTS